MNYRAWFVALIGITAACKAGGAFNWSSSGGSSGGGYNPRPSSSSSDSSSSSSSGETKAKPTTVAEADTKTESKPTPVPAAVAQSKESEFNAIGKSPEKAEAWFLKYAPIEIKAACGFDVKVSIDMESFKASDPNYGYDQPQTIVGDLMCGHVTQLYKNVCSDDAGKAAAKTVKHVHCTFVAGKLNTTPTTQIFVDGMGDKNALDLANGKLTLKFQRSAAQLQYEAVALPRAFPSVEWMRETAKDVKEWNREYTRWTEDKDGVEFAVDVDTEAFAKAGWLPAGSICDPSGRYSAPLSDFLNLLYKTTVKGKKILQGVKRITCSVTTDVNGKTPEIVGDRLIFYGRLLKEQIKGNTGPTIYNKHGVLPNNDAYVTYAMFRKAKNLGGECVWKSRYLDKDPEGDKWCGPEKD